MATVMIEIPETQVPPSRWGDPELSSPSHNAGQLKALRLALELFELGRRRESGEQFISLLVKEPVDEARLV